jgi:hypothetical protein
LSAQCSVTQQPATGVVYALGQVNFLFDRSSEPYVSHDDLADAFGLSKSWPARPETGP